MHKIRVLLSVFEGTLEHSCQNGHVSAVLMVSKSQTHFQAETDLGSQSQNAGQARAGRAAFKAPPPPLPHRFVQGRSAAAAVRPDPTRSRSQTRASRGPDSTASWARCVYPGGEVRRYGGPPASLALWPPRRSSSRPAQALRRSWGPRAGDDPDPDLGRGRHPRAAPIPRVALGWASTNARMLEYTSA